MSKRAREEIFSALASLASEQASAIATIDEQARALLADPDAMRPARCADTVVDAFMGRINGPKVAASAERIASLRELPAFVRQYVQARDLALNICVQPAAALTTLDWAGGGFEIGSQLDDSVAVGLARWGIAETGSVVVHSSTDTPILFHFLPAVSIVAVPLNALLWHLEDYAAAAREAGDPSPRNACLLTGASGTTDIEGSLVTGAHGPRELCIVVVDSVDAHETDG